jgi:hypothetical protein
MRLWRLFWRTLNGIARVRLALSRLVRYVLQDIYTDLGRCAFALGLTRNKTQLAPMPVYRETGAVHRSRGRTGDLAKPVIFVSACVDAEIPGGWKYNGGIKEYNGLVKLLREQGYEAYIVTYDGSYIPWLIEHQPHISMAEFRSRIKSLPDIRCVTSWAAAEAFIRECKKLYFWDMELFYTENEHFFILARLYKTKITNTAAISRTVQAWHMAHFAKPCTVIPNLLDGTYWCPDETRRVFNRVGFMDEGEYTGRHVELLQDAANTAGLELEFYLIRGDEQEVLRGMQTCNVFISMNMGKDLLWGEGCPRTVIEALSTGTMVLAYDIIGNREAIQDSFNGIMVPRYRVDIMAKTLVSIYKTPSEIERLRENGLNLIRSCHTFQARWPAIKEFLDL